MMITELQPFHVESKKSPEPEKRTETDCNPSGLCINCDHAAVCIHLKNSSKPILQCEEYSVTGKRHTSPTGSQTKQSEKAPSPTLKGLCVNCDRRETCCFEKPEGGVWHCEEYL